MRDLFIVLVRVPSLPSEQTTMMHVKYLGNKPTNMSSCSVVLSIPIVHGKYSVFREFWEDKFWKGINLVPTIRIPGPGCSKLDSAIHQINPYPMGKYYDN